MLHNDFASLCYILQQNNVNGILISILMDEINRRSNKSQMYIEQVKNLFLKLQVEKE